MYYDLELTGLRVVVTNYTQPTRFAESGTRAVDCDKVQMTMYVSVCVEQALIR